MTTVEKYAWCILLSLIGLAWVSSGISGVACLITGFFISQIDIGWLEEVGVKQPPQPEATNVIKLPVRTAAK